MPVQDSTLFIDRLRESGLLDAALLAELELLPEAKDSDPRALARVVFERGWLTRFQLSAVAARRAKDLNLGPYRLIDRLGEGGMGQVYKARHERMGRIVALKVIRKNKLGNDQAVQRFFQEVQAAAQLHHPNIVVAYDAGTIGAVNYLAMEYVDGMDLARLVQESGPLPVQQACEFIRQTALGLQHAHERGIVHRDIKPSNLLLAVSGSESSGGTEPPSEGTIKILDMGLARWHEPGKDRGLTKTGTVIGTPDYLAPEQALDASSADIRADLYSLGCTLHFLLTGKPPFQAESLTELLLKHQMNHPAALEAQRTDVPAGVAAIVRRLMAKRPGDRFPTPEALITALEPYCAADGQAIQRVVTPLAEPADFDAPWHALSDEGLPRRAPSIPTAADSSEARKGQGRAKRTTAYTEFVQRRPSWLPWVLAGGGAIFLLLVSVVIVLLIWHGSQEPIDTPKASRVPPPAQTPVKETPPPPEKQQPAVDDPHPAPQAKVEKPRADVAQELPPDPVETVTIVARPPAVPPQGKPPRAVGEDRLFNRQVGAVTALVASKDGHTALVATTEKGVWVWDMEKNRLQKNLPYRFPVPIETLGLSSDGSQLVAAYQDKLHTWDLTNGRPKIRRLPCRFLSPDGGYALSFSGPPEQRVARLRNVSTDREAHLFSNAPVEPVSASIVPECKRLAVGSTHGEVYLCEWEAEKWRKWKLQGEGAVTVALARQGHRVVTSSTGFGVCVWDAENGKLLRRLDGQSAAPGTLMISDDGRFVIAGDEEGLIRLWHAGSGHVIQEYQGHKGAVTCLAPFTNERFLSGGADGTMRMWRLFPVDKNIITPPTKSARQTSK
jgi:serine/threonine-protein kinase